MLLAHSATPDGRRTLIIGLSEGNLAHLRNDEPILRPLDGEGTGRPDDGPHIPGLEGWSLCILGPDDTARFIALAGRDPAELGP